LQAEASDRRQAFAEALAARTRLIAQARELKNGNRAAFAVVDSEALAEDLEETAQEADALLAVSDHLARMASWPTSVRAVMYAERAEFLQRFPELGDEYVQRAVDDRYIAFLAGSA
jgi:hypothetical protein